MRARTPDRVGRVVHHGVGIGYEVHGDGSPTLLLLPTWTIVHSRIWKQQVAYLARRHRVVVFDGPGNGMSDRPHDPDVYGADPVAEDAIAVMDATGTAEAILVSLSLGATWSLRLASAHPGRVLGQVFIAPALPFAPPSPDRESIAATFHERLADPQGWQKYNVHHWRHHLADFADFFFHECCTEPHSTKIIEDAVGWALETTGEVLEAETRSRTSDEATLRSWCEAVTSPTLVIHGTDDRLHPVGVGAALAEATGGDLLVLDGSGHLPLARDPIVVNLAIRDFVEEVCAPSSARHVGIRSGTTRRWSRALDRRPRALYVSSPIGLGHVRRDLAITAELRARRPDLRIDWLAQPPVTSVLEAEGEAVHPASRWLASESAHIASESAGHDLHCFQALRRMDEILVANFHVFQEVVEEEPYDLVIGDEAWDIDHFWHENPELKRGAHAWLTDFVGFLPMEAGGEREALLTADYNAEMVEHIGRFPRIRDTALFVGNPEDVVGDTFGPDLPGIREWTEDHFTFSGYITGFTPPTPTQAEQWRAELGYAPDELVCVVTVGGSGVGLEVLTKAVAAHPIARSSLPNLRTVVVAGPRIDVRGLPTHPGLEVHGYVERLYRHLSVCDLAVVQGGLTTTMELTAAKRPFLYFPLRNHFEQRVHVRHRLERYGAGVCMEADCTTSEALADAIVTTIGRAVSYRDVETGGAARAAAHIAELV